MRSAIAELVRLIQEREWAIVDATSWMLDKLDTDWASFVARRPNLANATASNITSPQFMDYST